jgi:hypothetical protein
VDDVLLTDDDVSESPKSIRTMGKKGCCCLSLPSTSIVAEKDEAFTAGRGASVGAAAAAAVEEDDPAACRTKDGGFEDDEEAANGSISPAPVASEKPSEETCPPTSFAEVLPWLAWKETRLGSWESTAADFAPIDDDDDGAPSFDVVGGRPRALVGLAVSTSTPLGWGSPLIIILLVVRSPWIRWAL